MITVIKNKEGYIYAYCEWLLTDEEGNWDSFGSYVWVNDLFIHKSIRGKVKIIREFIDRISTKEAPSARYVYWSRKKYTDKSGKERIKLFTRKQITR